MRERERRGGDGDGGSARVAPRRVGGPVLAKATARTTGQMAAGVGVQAREPAGGGQPLPAPVQASMEASFDADFSAVRWQEDGDATARGADAYARGDDLVFAPGQFDPGSHDGRSLIGHELAHVLQQREGRVAAPQGRGGDTDVLDDAGLEAEADTMGERAARGEPAGGGGTSAAAAGAASDAPIQRRTTVTAVPATFEADAAVKARTVARFLEYTRGQADWSTHYTGPDKADLQQLLHDLLADASFAAGTQEMVVSTVLALSSADRADLERYCAAVHHADAVPTAKMQRISDVARGVLVGKTLPRLETAVGGGGVLYHITAPRSVNDLIDAGRVDELIAYCTSKNPQWQVPDGKEFTSFLTMPVGFAVVGAMLPDVRNLHHFAFPALTRLMVDRLGGHAGKPLTLILHSGVDHNGAFHHDGHLAAAITGSPNRVAMIEGKETLADIQSELGPIAAAYGGGHIDQVMIAGHGNSRVMDLAGSTSVGTDGSGRPTVDQHDDTLDLDNNAAATTAFFDELIRHMDGPNRRIVLNACLTASNDLTVDPTGGDPAVQIRDQLAANGSLANTVRDRVAAAGASVDVIGANASFPEGPDLMDPSGRLDIIWTEDPALTAIDKLDYIRSGRESTGVLRAVLERWEAPAGGATPPWLDAVNTRMATHVDTWEGALIEACLRTIQGAAANAAQISELAHNTEPVSLGYFRQFAHVSDLTPVVAGRRALLFAAVEACAEWPGEDAIAPLAIYQVWGASDASKYASLVAHLGAHSFTTSMAEGFFDFGFLGARLGQLLPMASAAMPSRGQLVIACSSVLEGNGGVARDFLRATARAGGGRFAPALGLGGIADNSTEDEILTAIGMGAGGGGAGGGGATHVDANVDRDGDGTNESFVERIAAHGTVVNCSTLRVHAGPGNAAAEVGFLSAGDRVFAFGTRNGWIAIELPGGGTGYVWRDFLALS
jgi:hypothetical protein